MRAKRSSWLPGCPPPPNFEHFEEHFQRRFQSQSGLNQDDKKGRKAAWFPWRTNFQIFKDSLQCGFQDSPNLNQDERKDKISDASWQEDFGCHETELRGDRRTS
ncbi:hypothetical protein L3Y34_006000 [Caenorhabditis briggsae]|uniref:Uncharacterized protein n=1 Tax=Caenorhabditis briggsae TaxID=6238 RepID=A0AAE8ZVH3_CAEBR|nr:hypothetical protein L3Y34_006000 [Caenorhabditis briggsae]